MKPTSRRAFLQRTAAAGAAASVPPVIARALATPADRRTGTIRDIRHVVILMQENRAFDHYFGSLRGVRGFDDPRPLILPSGDPVWRQPGPSGAVTPFRLNSATTSAECMASLDHSWKGRHERWKNHDAWIAAKGPLTMGYFTREDLPFYYALADAFTICDGYHASIFGPTNPNRMFLFTGTSGLSAGHVGPFNVANHDDGNWTGDPAHDRPGFEAYAWTTYAERLEAAGVSWKLYQEYDNYGDNALAYFKAFRGLAADSPLYRKARTIVPGSSVHNAVSAAGEPLTAALAADVKAGTLPAVSWIVAPFHVCEHPDASPARGEAFTAGIVAALTADPEVWSKTVLLVNYDENDGFFDHAPPPLPPAGVAPGASTVVTDGEVYDGQPVGLGPRVPMLVVSPFSAGGWVNSQVFDHTSVLRFLEARFGVAEPNISPWRRAVTGDLTTAFDFAHPRAAPPELPSTEGAGARVAAACRLARPQVPASTPPARQERGLRPARALPYDLEIVARAGGESLTLSFINRGGAGAAFSLHQGGGAAGPWYYTVEAGKSLEGAWPHEPAGTGYDLVAYGPNGFLRAFRGSPTPSLRVETNYDRAADRLVVTVRNDSPSALEAVITPGDYARTAPRRRKLAVGATVRETWPIRASAHWYDLSVTTPADPHFLRRMAGHVETGAPSFSDPAIGRG